MKQRIITAVALLPLLIAVFIFSDTIVWDIAVTVLSCLAVYEVLNCTGMTKNWALSIPSLLYGALLPLFSQNSYKYLYNVTILYVLLILSCGVLSKNTIHTREITLVCSLTIYAANAFSALIMLRRIEAVGLYLTIFVFIGAWITDIFAYFCGRFFGKHKMLPEVSPKKTWEGAIGGAVFCTGGFVLFGTILAMKYGLEANIPGLIAAGLASSVVGQLGDLIASAIKRNFDIKDFGWIFPGHGGVLDRFDSIISVAPFILAVTSRMDIFYILK